MNLGLRDRVAIVAAGSKGLGRAIAQEMAGEGAAVVICARGEAALDATRSSIEEKGGRVRAVIADVSCVEDIERVVCGAEEEFGRVDILVTNSGGPKPGPFEALTREDWEDATRVVLTNAVAFTRAVLPGMKSRRWGRILNITSIAAKQPVDGLMLSNSLRAAVTAFARTLANEVAPFGITVNNLMPGFTRTERVVELSEHKAALEATAPSAIIERWEKEIPMGRLGEPQEFAAMATFLASERASYVTGQSIAVDGGWIRSIL